MRFYKVELRTVNIQKQYFSFNNNYIFKKLIAKGGTAIMPQKVIFIFVMTQLVTID